jgi:hypothetical protein
MNNALAYDNAAVVAVNSDIEDLGLGANPTTVSFASTTVTFYICR